MGKRPQIASRSPNDELIRSGVNLVPHFFLRRFGTSSPVTRMAFISIDPDRRVQPSAWPVPDVLLSSLTAFSSIGFATHCRLKSGLKLGAHRPARRGRSQVNASELSHECLPYSLAAFFKKLGANRELPGRRSEPASPCAHVGQQWHKLNRRFSEAVNRLLFVGWVVGAQEETGLD